MNAITALHKANCIAALAVLSAGAFDETTRQKAQRTHLIAEIVATNDVMVEADQKPMSDLIERGKAEVWKRLWAKTEKELRVRGVKV